MQQTDVTKQHVLGLSSQHVSVKSLPNMSGHNDKGAGTTYKIPLTDCMQTYTVQSDTHTHTQSPKISPSPPLTDKMCVWPRKTICVYILTEKYGCFSTILLTVCMKTNTHTPHLVNGWTGCDSGCLFEPIPRPHTHTQTHTTVRSVVGGETGSYVHRPVCT